VFYANPFFLPSNSNFCSSENSTLLPCCAASKLSKRLTAVGKHLSCQLRVKGHGRGLGLLGVKEAILEGLLIGQSLDVIPGHVGPVVDIPRGLPHVPCPKGKDLEASHGKLGELVSRFIPPRLPDGTADLLDDVVGEVLKYIEGGDHLGVIESFRRSLAEEKYSLEHVDYVLVNSCLDEGRFTLRVFCSFSIVVITVVFDSQFVRVDAPLMPRLAMGFQGFKLSVRHQPFLEILRVLPSESCHCKALSQVKVK
jgi:hypothetical protein